MKSRFKLRKRVSGVLLAAMSTALFLGPGNPAVASSLLQVSSSYSLIFSPTQNSAQITGLSVQGSATYIQADIQLTDLKDLPVVADDRYGLAIGSQCEFETEWTNPSTGNSVVLSGDNSTEVLVAGAMVDVDAALQNLWVYNRAGEVCASGITVGNPLVSRKLRIAAVQTQPGVWWNSYTRHYYELVTNTTDDGMGQPTDSTGTVTDSNRYFVKWTTARAAAKARQLNVNGVTLNGYLASITSQPEFKFVNSNVSGNGKDVKPAWVGGTEADHAGTWVWVDGPEAANFGGDTFGTGTVSDPEGRQLQQDGSGYYVDFSGHKSYESSVLLLRDATGAVIRDATTGYLQAANLSIYCNNKPGASFSGSIEIDPTPYGTQIICLPENPYIEPIGSSNYWYRFSEQAILRLEADGSTSTDADSNLLAVQRGTPDFVGGAYNGAVFWGPDSYSYESYDPCTQRGVKGSCAVQQRDLAGHLIRSSYYVNWSSGDQNFWSSFDGLNVNPGDGIYYPQPDNSSLTNSNEPTALMVNWCSRNADLNAAVSSAHQQTLYGNAGYFCNSGWTAKPYSTWPGASSTYSGVGYETPNESGTTDYIVEYCGYSGDNCDAPAGATAVLRFTIDNFNEPLIASFEQPAVQSTSVTSPSLTTESFNDLEAVDCAFGCSISTAVGTLNGSFVIAPENVYGGAGAVGNYLSPVDATLTPTSPQRFLGLWWSAGNAANYVDFLDSQGNVIVSFSAADLVRQLGSCVGNSYCGNPNSKHSGQVPGELFTYTNFRIDGGFSAVRLYGTGFELDNISISATSPARGAGETLISSDTVRNDCSGLTLTDFQSAMIACPQSVNAVVNQSLLVEPLANSPVAGYTYPAEARLLHVSVFSGACSVAMASETTFNVTALAAGDCVVQYTVTDGNTSDVSRITVSATGNSAVAINAPTVLPVDPRAIEVTVPRMPISSDLSATVCLIQAADSSGTIASTLTYKPQLSAAVSGVTSDSASNGLLISGVSADLENASALVSLASLTATPLTRNGSVYLRVAAVTSSTLDSNACSSATFEVVEVRALDLSTIENLQVSLAKN